MSRAAKHFQKTAQRFEDEDGFSSSSFHNLEYDVVCHERTAARMHLIRNEAAMKNVVDMIGISAEESKVREGEDIIVLDTVIDTQKLLQETVSRSKLIPSAQDRIRSSSYTLPRL